MREIKIHCGNCTHTFPFCHPSTSHAVQLANLSILCPSCKVELMMPVDEVHFIPRTEVSERALNELKSFMKEEPPTPKVMPPHPVEKPAEVIPIGRARKQRTRRPHLDQKPFQGLKNLLDPS